MGKKRVSPILEERLLIEDEDKKILKAINDLSPYDTGKIYVVGNEQNREIPTVSQISGKTNLSQEKVKEKLEEIRKKWNIPEPENLPRNRGVYDEEDALVSAIHNQDKLRWNEKTGKYRIPKIHYFNSELGLGTLYSNDKALRGEKIFRKAMNLDEKLNSYNIHGTMPEIMSMYGKSKHQRALHVGLNKTGKEPDKEQTELIKQTLNLSDEEMEDRDWRNLKNYVINTIDSRKEAAKSVGYELGENLIGKNFSEDTMINLFWTYNDDANLKEEEDLILSSIQKIRNKMKKAAKGLPELQEKYKQTKRETAEKYVEQKITDKLYNYLVRQQPEKSENSNGNNNGKNKNGYKREEFFNNIHEFFKKGGKKPQESKGLKNEIRQKYFKILERKPDKGGKESFDELYETITQKFMPEDKGPRTMNQLEKMKEKEDKMFKKLLSKKSSLEDDISEQEEYSNARMTEELEGHAWLTHKVAMTPTEAKVIEMLKKSNYKKLHEETLIPAIKEAAGKDLNIKLHTDREISVFVPDKEYLINNKGQTKEDALIEDGTIITSVPRTNRQRSNEPLKESFAELQQFQKNKLSEREQKQNKRPKTYGEFNKRDFANSDIYWTSYGSDGFRHQPKFEKAPTRIRGEYRIDPKIIHFLKTPTRHDTKKLGELMTKGSTGTLAGKRLKKGGSTTGNSIYIENPDQSYTKIFIKDDFYEEIEEKYGSRIRGSEEKISELEEKLQRVKVKNSKEKIKKQIKNEREKIQNMYKKIKPEIKYILLGNDTHAGSATWPGRPSSIDATRGSQLAALQSIGLDKFSYYMETEGLHGELGFGAYDSKREGYEEDPLTFELKMDALTRQLKKKKTPYKKILEYQQLYNKENNEARPIFKITQQKELFRKFEVPLMEELLERGVHMFLGAGNHMQGGNRGKDDEGDMIANMVDSKYHEQFLIYNPKAEGNDYPFRPVRLPSNPGYDIQALMTHKMQSGKTEISKMINQAIGTKEEALFAITADRHHGGMVAERGKFGVLDMGKQPMIEYASKIGKESSVRGTMTVGYGMNKELMYSGRYFADNVYDKIIGWNNKAEILKKAHGMIKEEMKNNSFAREKKRLDYIIENNNRKNSRNK